MPGAEVVAGRPEGLGYFIFGDGSEVPSTLITTLTTPMDNNYLLEFLIEGDESTLAVTIPRTGNVDQLRELIRSMGGIDRFHLRDLKLFKVCHDHSPK